MIRQISRIFLNNLSKQRDETKFLHTTAALNGKLLNVTEKNGIRDIKFNDPKTRNALSIAMMNELHEAINHNIDSDDLRVILLSSTGPVWSAGHNLKELGPGTDSEQHRRIFKKLISIIMSIRQAPVPVIAKVDALATAGGCQLAASCDMIIGSERSTYCCPGADVGIFCSTPGVPITRAMSKMKSGFMLFTGLTMSAKDANIAGLVSCILPNEKFDEEADKICHAITRKSRAIIKLGKEFYYKQLNMNIEEAFALAEETMIKNLATNDGKEGVKSFIEKRKPVWTHKL